MRAVVTVLVIVGGLIVQAIPSPAYAWYDHWGRWHPNYYHHHYYYHPYGYYHHYNRHPAVRLRAALLSSALLLSS